MTDEPAPPPEPPETDAARDVALMARVRDGDVAAFQELVEAHQHRVVGTVAKMLGDDSEAEDVAQQVFLRVWRSAARWEPSAKFTTWLYTIMRNLVFNELRRRKRRNLVSLDAPREFEDSERPREMKDDSVNPPDAATLDGEMHRAIDRAIRELPEMQRMAIVMRRWDDVSYEEIGAALDLSVPAVKSVIFRAREALREKLRQYLEE